MELIVDNADKKVAKRNAVYELEDVMSTLPQTDIPVVHNWAAGVYTRTMIMPQGSTVIGEEHIHPCINILSAGKVRVVNVADEEDYTDHAAPDVFISPEGTKRAIHAIECTVWTTCHATEETDLEKLNKLFIKDQA